MGVCRWEPKLTASIMSRFPRIVTRYMETNRLKMRGCSSELSESPRRINSGRDDRFMAFMLVRNLIKNIGSKHKKN
jgi:hypothetical protein